MSTSQQDMRAEFVKYCDGKCSMSRALEKDGSFQEPEFEFAFSIWQHQQQKIDECESVGQYIINQRNERIQELLATIRRLEAK